MFKQMCAGFIIIITTLLVISPAASQAGRGVIVEPAVAGIPDNTSFNPQFCQDAACTRLSEFLFPTLFATDPASGMLVSAAAANDGLVVNPTLQDGTMQTLKLRDDLKWSDGKPVTAYDVFYSYLAYVSTAPSFGDQITGAQVIDDHTIAFQYAATDCSSLTRSNFRVLPFHYANPDVRRVNELNAAQDGIQPYKSWFDAMPELFFPGYSISNPNPNPMPTAGIFALNDVRPGEAVRLTSDSTDFVYATIPDGLSATDFFLAGKASVLVNPPLERRDDLRATLGLQIADMPSAQWDAIIFNTADPNKPRNAFNDQGKPLEQGHHPLFSDIRVRHAVQMAIDIHEIGEVVYQGNITPIAANLPPTSWAYNPDLKPLAYDPIGAGRLLEEAGWKDTNNDGVRECHGCLYAHEGDLLAFSLSADPLQDLYQVASLIAQQLAKAGFLVNSSGGSDVSGQSFDAHLTTFYNQDSDPDQSALFTRARDVISHGNAGSYVNDQVDTLMQQARSVPSCDPQARAKIYRQIQAILHDDQPYAWLYARNDMVVAQGGVLGFAPFAGNPFWNIRDWVVTS